MMIKIWIQKKTLLLGQNQNNSVIEITSEQNRWNQLAMQSQTNNRFDIERNSDNFNTVYEISAEVKKWKSAKKSEVYRIQSIKHEIKFKNYNRDWMKEKGKFVTSKTSKDEKKKPNQLPSEKSFAFLI